MLSSTARTRQAPALGPLHSPRSWFLLCVFLACQLLINYILKSEPGGDGVGIVCRTSGQGRPSLPPRHLAL